jgi:hypothetical protein
MSPTTATARRPALPARTSDTGSATPRGGGLRSSDRRQLLPPDWVRRMVAGVVVAVLAAASCGAVPRVYPPPGLLAVAPVTAGDQLQAWADRLQPAPADHLTASCAVVLVWERTITASGGQRIREQFRVRQRDGSGYQLSEARPVDWGHTRKARLGEPWNPASPAVTVTTYPPGRLNLIHGPPSADPTVLASQLRQLHPGAGGPAGAGALLRAVADLATWYHLDRPVRAALLRLLAGAGIGLSTRGEGLTLSARSGPVVDLLQFDYSTGQLLAAYQEYDTGNGPAQPARDRLWHRHAHPDDEGAPFYTTNPAAKAQQRLHHACHTTDPTISPLPPADPHAEPGSPGGPELPPRPQPPTVELHPAGATGPPYTAVPGAGTGQHSAVCGTGVATDPAPAMPATPTQPAPRLRLLDPDHTEPATPRLHELATRIGAADSDEQTGPCAHIAVTEWATAPTTPTRMRLFGRQQHRYRGSDGSGRIITTNLQQPARRTVIDYPPGGLPPPFAGTMLLDGPTWHPDDPIAQVLHPDPRVGLLLAIAELNGSVVPGRGQRAGVIDALATTGGFTYRGHAIDHIGRTGIVVTADHHGDRHLLLLNETTGELLAYTHTHPAVTSRRNLAHYTLYTDRGHQPAPTT